MNERIENKKVIKTAEIESDLWLEGKNMGKLTAKFSIEHYPYTRQKLAGVMTEQGLQKSAPIIMGKGNNPKIKELSVSLNELKELYFNENTANNEIQVMIEQKLSFINKLLQESDKISSVSFIYKDIQEIMNAQLIFIEIATTLINSYQKMDAFMDETYYACLDSVFKRGELDLSSLCFEINKGKKIIDLKTNIALKYQTLIYNILGMTFADLQQKGLSEYHRNFIEFFLSYSYFRIPEFRTELLDVLSSNSLKKGNHHGNRDIESVLLDWDKDFYNHIMNEDEFVTNKNKLAMMLQTGWRDKFRKKGVIFFYFIKEWCLYISQTLVVKNFNWHNIVGYDIIIKTFLEQMNNKEISKYSDIMIEASLSLLTDPYILDKMVRIIITKTK